VHAEVYYDKLKINTLNINTSERVNTMIDGILTIEKATKQGNINKKYHSEYF